MQDVAARWNKITRDIGEVVSSLQFHDITRQRIEHAKESLVEMADGGPGALAACELQRAQLDHARIEVLSAIERIVESLRDLARHVDEMCEATRTLVKVTDADISGSSFISSLEKSFSALTGSIAEYDRINEELAATLDHAVRTIGAMSEFIGDIEKIGIEIRMIGLNACIRAAHVGEKGAALGVLADSIHQLSADTSGPCRQDIGKPENGHPVSPGIDRQGQPREAGDDKGRRQLEQDVARMMKPLRRVDEETLAILRRINAKGKALSDDITAAYSGIQVHAQFDRGIDDVVGRLDACIARMKSFLPVNGRSEPNAGLEELAGRYTMHSERQVHEAVAGGELSALGPTVAAPESTAETLDAGGQGLGDNVELF